MEDSDKKAVTYRLTLKGDGVTVEREVTEDHARQIIAIVMGGAAMAGAPARPSASAGGITRAASGQIPALREFVDEVGAQRNPEKIVAIGAYLVDHLGQDNFSREEVKSQFKNAGEGVPGNYPRDFRWAIIAGWIAPDPNTSGRFFVTDSGRDALTQKFPDEIRERTRQAKTTRRRRRKAGEKAGE